MSGETREEARAEIGAIFARLKEELRGGPARLGENRAEDARIALPSRAQAERTWAVSAERPFEQAPGRRGLVQAYVIVPVKRALRKLMRWYVEPVAAQQRSYNLAILTLVDELADRVDAELADLERRLQALEGGRAGDRVDRR
jgi:hypothetical protein